jgi:hypothetical protein
VAGADPAGVDETELARRLERLEDRHAPLDVLGVPADHQRISVLPPPDPAGDADIEVSDAVLAQPRGARDVVGEPGVAAVDDDVALGEQPGQLVDDLPGHLGRHHHPDHPGRGELVRQFGEAGRVGGLRVAGEADDLVPGGAQPLAHVAAHPAEADETELHVRTPSGRVSRRCGPA